MSLLKQHIIVRLVSYLYRYNNFNNIHESVNYLSYLTEVGSTDIILMADGH